MGFGADAAREPFPIDIRPLVLLVCATFLPNEVHISIGEFQLYAYRIALLLTFPWVAMMLWRGAIRLILPDFLVIFGGLWMFVAMSAVYGLATGLQSGGVQAFDTISAYLLARICLRSVSSIRRLLTIIWPLVIVAGGILVVESLTERLIVRPFAQSIFGSVANGTGAGEGVDGIGYQYRFGLLRASGLFPHPILAGLEMASFLSLYFFARVSAGRKTLAILAALMAFFTLSSAGILALILAGGLILYELLQRRVEGLNWSTLFWMTAAVAFLLEIFTKSGALSVFIRYFTLDQATGFYRLIIWQYASVQVMMEPWFGIGFEGYARPDWLTNSSIDSHWLLLAVRFGLPASLAMAAAVVVAIIMSGRTMRRVGAEERDHLVGLTISLAVLATLMFTVTLWGGPLAWFMVLLGGTISCAAAMDKHAA